MLTLLTTSSTAMNAVLACSRYSINWGMYEEWVSGFGRRRRGRHEDAYCPLQEITACRGGRGRYSRLTHTQGEQK